MAAGEIFLQCDVIAFLDPPAIARRIPEFFDVADDLVPKDAGAELVAEIFAPIAAADAGSDHPQQPGIAGDFRQRQLAQLGLARAYHDGGKARLWAHEFFIGGDATPDKPGSEAEFARSSAMGRGMGFASKKVFQGPLDRAFSRGVASSGFCSGSGGRAFQPPQKQKGGTRRWAPVLAAVRQSVR